MTAISQNVSARDYAQRIVEPEGEITCGVVAGSSWHLAVHYDHYFSELHAGLHGPMCLLDLLELENPRGLRLVGARSDAVHNLVEGDLRERELCAAGDYRAGERRQVPTAWNLEDRLDG